LNGTHRGPVQGVEARKYTRLRPREGAYAALQAANGGHGKPVVGQIIDISRGGLAVRYMSNEQPPSLSSELDIFIARNNYYLRSLPYSTVADSELKENIAYSHIKMRRCSVRFGALTHDLQRELEDFLLNHTIDELSDHDFGY